MALLQIIFKIDFLHKNPKNNPLLQEPNSVLMKKKFTAQLIIIE